MKFDYKDWEVDTQPIGGNDDNIYGNYVDWDDFRFQHEEELLDYFGISLPWGEELPMLDYLDFVSQEVFCSTSIINDFELNNLEVLEDIEQGSTLSEITLQFPSRNDNNSEEIISAIFDYYEVPSGIEEEYDLPEDLQYWHSMLKNDFLRNEYEYYQNYPLTFVDYENKISDIQSDITASLDERYKKSLLLYSFTISESLLTSVINANIPKESGISQFSQKILSKEIDKKLRGRVSDRNNLFKELFNQKAPNQEWIALRNSLAHDIESPTISDDSITYKNLKDGSECTVKVDDLFIQQRKFFEELKRVIDNTNINDLEV